MAVAHKSAISVGLLYIPVDLYKTTRDISVSFNQLCRDTNERIRYKKICPSCNKEVSGDEIIKGYEYEKGKYVTFTEDELEKIKTKKDKTIHILHFAKLTDVNQIYYEKNYYAVPETGAEKAYELLRQAMLSNQKVGIAKTVIGTTENLIVLYPTETGIIAKTLFYQAEIQAVPVASAKPQAETAELEMAKTLIDTMTSEFEPGLYHDEYQERLRAAIEAKITGKEIVSADTSRPDNVIDLMEAMKKTVEMSRRGTA
ncbi:DNA end-binding protein Ku [Anaerocolumna jejuensis DSM 15929]|uniref:Non-homologous end joining protein Ku n=1 Tax=Anaerocolumna jejuensis DSM 15929 TaxID=1121322 RepID=A0A1M6QPA8_9FIRM|nr:Ku protein [Anaerocolumna jejuensis]SHK21847.1 DNA end-binding protein Ku [Anaerocolumna jejuensis DSM 15929]